MSPDNTVSEAEALRSELEDAYARLEQASKDADIRERLAFAKGEVAGMARAVKVMAHRAVESDY